MALFKSIKSPLILLFSGLIYAVALKYFVIPTHIIVTGTEGISLSISYFVEKYWVFVALYAVFQTLLIGFSMMKLGMKFTVRTIWVVTSIILLLVVLPHIQIAKPESENEKLILVIFGGLLAGLAKAIALRQGGSVGDEDIVSAYFAQRYAIPIGRVVAVAGVISTFFGLGLIFFKTHQIPSVINTLMYAAVYIFVCRETLDSLFRHFDLCRIVIITQSPQEFIDIIDHFSERRTYTLQWVSGGYSKVEHAMLTVLVTASELPKLVRQFKDRNTKGFIYHHNVDGVIGDYYYDPIAK